MDSVDPRFPPFPQLTSSTRWRFSFLLLVSPVSTNGQQTPCRFLCRTETTSINQVLHYLYFSSHLVHKHTLGGRDNKSSLQNLHISFALLTLCLSPHTNSQQPAVPQRKQQRKRTVSF
ncbi:uncharacterized protein EI90DRAFT_3073372 [Cantharellus anzutake]|uniref:uncharacterized protein n=1 Tax=Cantharellus anzutake TaxID=1750568 RepID=UPI0019066E99|nr:uncharacterized protein EI90DRAFT_3073372 [Cantharellus anzutake]KAF8325210.1 hypothetical protein EI90DRAFT_3073372 [Cantharellus anzutake]